ncbi:MAG: hypothetical protein HC906_11675 [Bacteroidales bacterium]|nr:hypothetical protein [Bacteroidales bacterium]
MEISYSPDFTGNGAFYTWKSDHKNVGNGKLTIIASQPYDSIKTEMDFMEQGTASAYYLFNPTDSGTIVTWGFDSDMGMNPITRYFGLMMDKWIGTDYEKGLNKLAEVSEHHTGYVIELQQLNSFNYVSIRKNTPWENVAKVMGESYSKLMDYIKNSKAEMTGAPLPFTMK